MNLPEVLRKASGRLNTAEVRFLAGVGLLLLCVIK